MEPIPIPAPPDPTPAWDWSGIQVFLHSLLGIATVVMLALQGCNKQPTPIPGPLPDNVTKEIELPPIVKGSHSTFIDIVAKTTGEKVEWYVDPRLSTRQLDPVAQKTISVVAKESGTYLVLAWTSINGKPTAFALSSVVVGDGDSPTPTPIPPGPGPKPPTPPGPGPAPSVSKLYAVVIEDTAAAKNNRWAYYSDMELVKYFRSKGYILRVEDKSVVDKDGQPPKDLQSYLKASQGMTLPVLFLVNQDGKELYKGALPGTTGADLLALAKKVGG